MGFMGGVSKVPIRQVGNGILVDKLIGFIMLIGENMQLG